MSDSHPTQKQTPSGLVVVVTILASLLFFGAVLRVALQTDDGSQENEQAAVSVEKKPAEKQPSQPDQDVKQESPQGPPGEEEPNAPTEKENPQEPGPEQPTDSGEKQQPVEPAWVQQVAREPTSWRSQAFRRFDTKASIPRVAELKQWFEQAPLSPPPAFRLTNTSVGKCGVFRGIMRLTPPVDSPSALRLDLKNSDKLRIHAFRGEQGITLIQYSNSQWVAYQTQRHAGAPTPARLRLAATDDQRAVRTSFGNGPFELCFWPNEIALTRGDIILLRAPFDGLPSDVFFEGGASFQGISLRRLSETPAPPADRDSAQQLAAQLEWNTSQVEQGKFEKLESGGVRLRSEATSSKHGRVWAPLDDIGLSVIDVQLSNVTAGSGVYLADESGTPRYQLRFVRNSTDGETCAALRADSTYEYDLSRYDTRLTPSVARQLWARFAAGGSQLRAWISVDGKHWASVGVASHGKTALKTIGLSYVAKAPDVSLQVNQIRLAKLEGFRQLAKKPLLDNARPCRQPTLEAWHLDSIQTLPKGVSLDDWRTATAIRSLEHWSSPALCDYLGWTTLQLAIESDRPIEQKLAALEDGALVLNLASNANLARFASLYETLAMSTPADEPSQFSAVLRSLFATPLLSPYRMTAPSKEWIHEELLRSVYAKDPQQLQDFLSVVKFYGWQSRSPLTPWAEALAMRARPLEADSSVSATSRGSWRPTIVEDLDREAFNRISELDAALQSENFSDAAEIAASIRNVHSSGVAPAPDDPALLQSVSAALRDVLSHFPDVADELEKQHREIAQLRLQRAMDDSDEAAVRTIAIQFGKMETAAQASLWLGDRNLSKGRIREALTDYAEASHCAALQQDAASRIRLAYSLLGRESESANVDGQGDVRFADAQFTSAEYDALLGGLAKSHQAPPAPSWSLQPVKFAVHFAGKLDGQLGKSPTRATIGNSSQYASDWPVRQLSQVRVGNTLFVSNRFQIAAFNLPDGKRLWTSEKALGEPLPSQDWFLTRTKPLVRSEAVYGRFLYGAGPRLVKLNRKDGKLLWATPSSSSLYIVSDPFFAEGRLLALTVTRGQQQSRLTLTEFDSETGALRDEKRLFELRDRWWKMRYCSVRTQPDGFLAALGGAIASCDYQGRLRWLRRQPQIPIDLDPSWMSQSFAEPHVFGKSIYYLQPASKEVVCLQRHTGRTRWRKVIHDATAICQATAERVVVQSRSGLHCFAADSGKLLWQYDDEQLQSTSYFGQNQALMIRGSNKPRRQSRTPQVLWIDLNTGRPTHSHELAELAHPLPHIGPLIMGPANVWAFLSTSINDADLDLLRLEPKGAAETIRQRSSDAWSREINDRGLQDTIHERLPSWQLWLGSTVHPKGVAKNAYGKNDQLGLRLSQQKPLLLAMHKPIGPRNLLRLKLGHNPAMKWRLEAFSNGRQVYQQEIAKETHPDSWFSLDIPWAKFPESGWVLLRFSHVSGTESDIYLESITFE